MKATDLLMTEHRVIEQVLECLARMIEETRLSGKLDPGPAADAVAFFRGFADRCHHGKEEERLFRLMERRGVDRDNGPIGVMLYEHNAGRRCVGAMADSIRGAAEGERESLHTFMRNGLQFIDLLRSHILKEDRILYPMANEVFSAQDQADLLAAFDHVEAHEMEAGAHERFLAVADAQGRRYNVGRAQHPDFGEGCWGCGHGCGG